MIGNFVLFVRQSLFFNADLLRAISEDAVQLYRHFTRGELLAFCAGVLLSAILALLVFLLSPLRPKLRDCYASLSWAGLALVGGVLLLVVIPLSSKSLRDFNVFQSIAKNQLHPTVSFLWSPLLYAFTEPKVQPIDLELAKRYTIEEYSRGAGAWTKPRKNILLFVVEAMRFDVINRVIDGKAVTPLLNRLASEGRFYTRAYAQSSESAYSFVNIATGMYSLRYEYRDSYATTAAYPSVRPYDLLAVNGYSTAFFSSANELWGNMIRLTYSPHLDRFFHAESAGKGHFKKTLLDEAFEGAKKTGRLKTGKLDDKTTTREVIRWIEEVSSMEQPFFALVEYQSSHFPYQQGLEIPEVFAPSAINPEDELKVSFGGYPKHLWPTMKNRYFNSLRYVDSLIGKVISTLKRKNIAQDTIIIVVGDHGELFGEHGTFAHSGFMYDIVLHVPIIIWGADEFVLRPSISPAMLIDVAPTILALASLPQHDNFQGRSLALYEDEVLEPKKDCLRAVFSSIQGFTSQDAVTVWPWKLIRDHFLHREYLFNAERDPDETNNFLSEEPVVARCLGLALDAYKKSQLYYYATPELRSQYFPPRYLLLDNYCSTEEIAVMEQQKIACRSSTKLPLTATGGSE
jgi:arylsulfatase A-like enzyme